MEKKFIDIEDREFIQNQIGKSLQDNEEGNAIMRRILLIHNKYYPEKAMNNYNKNCNCTNDISNLWQLIKKYNIEAECKEVIVEEPIIEQTEPVVEPTIKPIRKQAPKKRTPIKRTKK